MQQEITPELRFLKDGGEMGKLIRDYEWSSSPLGEPEDWPHSLRIALGIVLHSKFPMFIFWGVDHICFYNDAYRPSLGANGKHPGALGKPGYEVWPDIKPLIDDVLNGGEGTWSENQLLPIYRNGKLEDVYWTFSYSPIYDETGLPAGVFVTCTETTNQVRNQKALKKSEEHFRDLVKTAPVAMAIFKGFDLVAEMANDEYLPLVGKTREEFIGKPLFESLPEARELLEPVAHNVLKTGIPFHATELQVDLNRFGKNETCYFNAIYEAIHEPDGAISGMMVVAHEVTENVISRRQIEESEQRLRNVLEQAPDPILILKGEEMVLEVANQALLDLWQVTKEAIGKPFLEILPEMKEQGIYNMLIDVYRNGVTHHGYEMPVVFERKNGVKETIYFNFVYHPYREKDTTITGILVMASDVTGQVMSQKQFEENKADLNLAVEIGNLGTFRIDLSTNLATFSDRIKEWFGFTENTLPLEEVFESIATEDRERVEKAISVSLKNELQSQHDVTYTVIHPVTGEPKILRSIGKVIFTSDARAELITGIIQDITRQAIAQKQTEENAKNLRNIILQAPVAMCLLRGENFIVEVANERIFEIWGKSAKELMYKPIFEGLPEVKNQGFEELLTHVYTTGETYSAYAVPVSVPRNDKIETVFLDFVYEPYHETNGKISGVMAVALDVTEQVKARQQVELAEERARLAIDSAGLGVYELNLITNEMHTTARFDAIFGFDHTVPRENYVKKIHPDDLTVRDNAHKESLESGKLFYEARILWDDGSVHWMRARGIVLFDNDHTPTKLLGVVQDITEHKQFADELTKQVADKTKDYQEAMEQLVKKNQELEQFAYVASHDLKEPLRMISSYSELLVRRIPQDEEAREYARYMTEGVSRMQALINDLLEYSRIGKKPVPPVAVDINTIVNSVRDTLHITIEETGAEISATQLPTVMGVPSLLSQLFQNLVDNALKFRKKDCTPEIHITAEPKNGRWKFSVSDNGIGIAEEYQDRIFIIFQRLHTRDQYPGTGIGLSVCKRIVELHGGEIWVESEKDKGTSFYFTLPAASVN